MSLQLTVFGFFPLTQHERVTTEESDDFVNCIK